MAWEKYHKTTIDCSKVRPHVKELVDRCGNVQAAAKYSLVGGSTIHRVLHGVNCSIQQATARKLLLALEHRREEDRKNHAVHERLLRARQEQARIERTQQELIGY